MTGGVYHYGRVVNGEIQVVLLVVDVYTENESRGCVSGDLGCTADVIEQITLYVGATYLLMRYLLL